ncbi:hypothetical protein ABEB36_008609 [Hypothenemus hampei]|uniref:Ribosome biogenesis regulatory protein n=1 Tax=Hypothenemus hampei TaxID=57062 RepID=A0ABD1EMW8_HYPHA
MDVVNEILGNSSKESNKYKPVTVKKHLELEYDLGTLLAVDPNDFNIDLYSKNPNEYFLNLARDNTQLLLNKLWELPTERVEEAVMVKLPPPKTALPRMKPVPKPRPLTKWQKFAKEKGIQKKKKPKLSWDDQLKKWVPLYGFKKAKAEKEKNWVLEVPQNADPNEDQFNKKLVAKTENVSKNDLQRLRNIAKNKNIKVPRFGTSNPEVSSAKDLKAAITIAKASTASLGKFQDKLHKEVEAKGVSAITPGASRKRKMTPLEPENKLNMNIVESILNKKPRLDVDKAVAKQLQTNTFVENSQQKQGTSKGSQKIKNKTNKKPKGSKGHRAGKKGGGRKRR